jgi:hypothetical protein
METRPFGLSLIVYVSTLRRIRLKEESDQSTKEVLHTQVQWCIAPIIRFHQKACVLG